MIVCRQVVPQSKLVRSIVFSHAVWVRLGPVWEAILYIVCKDLLSFLVNELVEEHGEEGADEWHGWIHINCWKCWEAVLEETRESDAHGDCWVSDSSVELGAHVLISWEDSSGSNVGTCNDETVYGFLVGEQKFFVCADLEEEYKEKADEELLDAGSDEWFVWDLSQLESEEVYKHGSDVSSQELHDDICNGQLPAKFAIVFSEDKCECDGWIEVRARNLPEEDGEDPESKKDDSTV